MINFTPSNVAFSIGPVQVYWYGLAYVAAIIAAYFVVTHEARRRGLDASLVADGLIVIAVAALIGGRAYHVIDQWNNLYANDPAKVFLPPYTGLGVYGGLATGAIALIVYARWKRQPFWRWGDVIVLGVLMAQVVGRWGNFFNQELYGPPTNLPWGIAIDCQHRVQAYLCPPNGTVAADAHFHPLFLYESLASLAGLLVLAWMLRRFVGRGRPLMTGDVGMLYFVWYGIERAALETFRTSYDWTFFGIPTAQLVGLGAASVAFAVIVIRHRFFRERFEAGEVAQPEAEAAAREHGELTPPETGDGEAGDSPDASTEPAEPPATPERMPDAEGPAPEPVSAARPDRVRREASE